MGIRNPKKEMLKRLECKTLDDQFVTLIREGMNCSLFEAQALLDTVHEVYGPYMGQTPRQSLPGRLTLVAVAAHEPAGKPISACLKQTVLLSVHRGAQDDRFMQAHGIMAWRRKRLVELCQQALSQGALLTREDLAWRIFFVGVRTISRDLAALRRAAPDQVIALRSLVHDIGPAISHREQIVRLALSGKTTTEICRRMRHSPEAVANYLATFSRCVQLAREGLHAAQIAFLLRRGRTLIEQYLVLAEEARQDPALAPGLERLAAPGLSHEKKVVRPEGRRP